MGQIDFVAAGFNGYHRADEVLKELRDMDHREVISILNAMTLKKDAQGDVTASDDGDVRAPGGAIFGALVGALIGFLGGPGGAVVGAAAGAITGGVTAAGFDLGFSPEMLDGLKDMLAPDHSAVVALVETEWVESYLHEIEARGGKILRSALREEVTDQVNKERDTE